MSILLKFGKNRRGRDFVVGDLHGHLRQLKQQLEGVDFDAGRDRLFFVGDLVDRGPDSEALLAMIDQQVYITIVGNHEAMMIAGCQDPAEAALHLMNGGEWFYRLPEERQRHWAGRARKWPWAIEIETGSGRVGLVHANLPGGDWTAMVRQLAAVEPARTAGVSPAEDPLATVARGVLWDRTLVERFYGDFLSSDTTAREIAAFKARELERVEQAGPGSCVEWVATAPQAQLQPFRITGIDSVYMGHSFVPIPVQVGDCHFLDSYRGEPGQMLGLVCISEP